MYRAGNNKKKHYSNDRFEIHSIDSAYNFPDIFQLSLRIIRLGKCMTEHAKNVFTPQTCCFCRMDLSGQPILPCSSIFHQLKNSGDIQLKGPQCYRSPRRWSPKRFLCREKSVKRTQRNKGQNKGKLVGIDTLKDFDVFFQVFF